MPDPLVDITLWRGQQEQYLGRSGLPLEVGRQSRDEIASELYQIHDHGNQFRVAIAPITSVGLPRQTLRVEMTDEGRLQLHNPHARSTFHVESAESSVLPGSRIKVDEGFTAYLPEDLTIRVKRVVELPDEPDTPHQVFRTIATTPLNVGGADSASPIDTMPVRPSVSLVQTFGEGSDVHRGQAAVDLVRQALTVVQKSAGSDEFFDTAVRSVASMIELDQAYVLLWSGEHWRVKAVYRRNQDESRESRAEDQPLPRGSRLLLKRVLQQKQTVIYEPETYRHTTSYDPSAGSSITLLDRAVAAPLFNESGEVAGVLYGDRSYGSVHHPHLADVPIGDLEATLLEVMAGAVTTGVIRQRHEAIQASLSQFFSPAVTERLEDNEDLLTGRDAEVTVLFCDIRGFSGITERVGPQKTIEWINDVLTKLSRCVTCTDGVLVDYVGDELMAMWGAPAEQPDHAQRACEAAQSMLRQVEPLRERWREITPDHFGIGIGINTGMARVGNTGSEVKFKYGPLGNTVNLASRVQGITKKFGVPALITQTTLDALERVQAGQPWTACVRRLATVQPVGVKEEVDLYQLTDETDVSWTELVQQYESALRAFQQSDLTTSARQLASLVHDHPGDVPSVVLLGRVVDAITGKIEKIDPVMRMQSK